MGILESLPVQRVRPVLFLPLWLGTLRDYSGYGNNSSVDGSGIYWNINGQSDGIHGGSSGRLTVPGSSSLESVVDFTLIMCGNFASTPGSGRLFSKRDAGGTHLEVFFGGATRFDIYDGSGSTSKDALDLSGVTSVAISCVSGNPAILYLDGSSAGSFSGASTISPDDAPIAVLNNTVGNSPAALGMQCIIWYPSVLAPSEISSVAKYEQARITPRKQWPGMGLRYPNRGDPYTPATGDPLFLDNIQTARVSLANETSGTLSNTTYHIESGSWKVAEDATTGERYIECVSAGIISRRNVDAYGTWEFTTSKPDSVSIDVSFITNERTGAAPGYRLLVNTSELVGLVRIGAANITISQSGYVDDSVYRYTITRSGSGEFTTYIEGGAYPRGTKLDSSGGGSNPNTDNAVTDSMYLTISAGAGCRLYLDHQFAGVVSPL